MSRLALMGACALAGCVEARTVDSQGKSAFISSPPTSSFDYSASGAGGVGGMSSGGTGGTAASIAGMKDTMGMVVPDGTYRVMIEVTESERTSSIVASVELEKGPAPASLSPADDGPFKDLTLSYTP